MTRTPLPCEMVNVAVPVFLVESLWLRIREVGLSEVEHGTTGLGEGLGDGDGVGVAVGVAVGDGLALPLPLPLPLPLSPPLPLPFPCGVAVGVGVGSVGSMESTGSGPGVPAMDGVDVGSGSTSPSPTGVRSNFGISPSGKCCASTVISPEPETSTGIDFPSNWLLTWYTHDRVTSHCCVSLPRQSNVTLREVVPNSTPGSS